MGRAALAGCNASARLQVSRDCMWRKLTGDASLMRLQRAMQVLDVVLTPPDEARTEIRGWLDKPIPRAVKGLPQAGSWHASCCHWCGEINCSW